VELECASSVSCCSDILFPGCEIKTVTDFMLLLETQRLVYDKKLYAMHDSFYGTSQRVLIRFISICIFEAVVY